MDVTNGDEICGRCLVNLNASTSIVAKWGTGNIEQPRSRTPAQLKTWAQEMLYGNGAHFEVDATNQRFEAVSTWHGDPVCGYHLWVLAEAEIRRGYA